MTDKEKIKAEIEKRYYEHQTGNKTSDIVSAMEEDREIMKFIDSIEEEPASEDLEEACDNYYDETWDEHGGVAMVVNNCHDIWFPSQATSDFFKAGVEWQKQQMMKDAVDAWVNTYESPDGCYYVEFVIDEPPANYRGKKNAKIIIVKED